MLVLAACGPGIVNDSVGGPGTTEGGDTRADSSTEDSGATVETGTAAESGAADTDGPTPMAIEAACTSVCELEFKCDSEAMLPWSSVAHCADECVEGQEAYLADGCVEIVQRLVCWGEFTCEEWLALVDTGYSACGDVPGGQWCGD